VNLPGNELTPEIGRLLSRQLCGVSQLVSDRAEPVQSELGAVHCHGAQLDQAALAHQANHLHEQCGQFLEMRCPKVLERAVCWVVLCRQHPQRNIFVQLGGELARAEDAAGVAVDQQLDHHGRVKGLVAWTALGVSRVKGAQVQDVHAVADEVRQVSFEHPLALKGSSQARKTKPRPCVS
jgi:hypothetical protein